MFINLLYDFALLILAIITLPKLLYQWVLHRKYRESLLQRLGLGFPVVTKNGRKLIWVHAVSVGETKAVSSLVKKIKKEQEDTLVILSTVTETGFAEAKRSVPEADFHVFLPFDFNWIIKPIVKRTSPDLVILCETDFWYNFLKCCKDQGSKIILVNGKLSARSLKRYLSFSVFSRKLFSLVDSFCIQSKHYRERFLSLGIPNEKLAVTGNLKFDGTFPQTSPKKRQDMKERWLLQPNDLVLVIGSTHDPEEKIILDALEEVWKQIPNLSIILVPRHPERFDEVASLLERRKTPYRRYSQLGKGTGQEKVVLLDTMGLLRECYQLADLALVAGSFTPKVGGHNIIEPSWYGVPVLFGPHMHAQPELVEFVVKYQAGLQIRPENLTSVLLNLLGHSEKRRALGKAGLEMVDDLAGATDRTYHVIKSL